MLPDKPEVACSLENCPNAAVILEFGSVCLNEGPQLFSEFGFSAASKATHEYLLANLRTIYSFDML